MEKKYGIISLILALLSFIYGLGLIWPTILKILIYMPLFTYAVIIATILGILSMIFSIISFIKREAAIFPIIAIILSLISLSFAFVFLIPALT